MTTWTNQRLAEERRRTDAALAHEERDLVGRQMWLDAHPYVEHAVGVVAVVAGLIFLGLAIRGCWL